MTVAIALPLTWLDDDAARLADMLEARLETFQPANHAKADYYELKQHLKDLGIALPPSLRNLEVVCGWPATAVDVLEERLNLRGWAGAGTNGLADVFDDNHLDVEASWAHLDALLYGTAFVAVSTGQDDEPDPLITIESPTLMTAITSPRTRRTEAALSIEQDDNGNTESATLYLEDVTLWLGARAGGRWTIEDRDDHNLGRVPVAQHVNRPRAGDMDGRSEITPAVRYLTDAAMRTLAASEVGREFFASPQRYVLGAPESFFQNEDGTPRSAWESYLGRILAIERDQADEIPTVGEFRGTTLTPYFDQIRSLSMLLSAESAIPAHYLGFITDNPASADAIRQSEARLIKRVERRQTNFGRTWAEVAELALLVRDGDLPDSFRPAAEWSLAATPTRAADADRVAKLIDAGVLRPDSPVTWSELGFTPEQQATLAGEFRQLEREYEAEQQAQAAAAAAAPPAPATPEPAPAAPAEAPAQP